MHNKAGLKLEEERYEAPGGKVVTKSTKMLSNFKPTDEVTVRRRPTIRPGPVGGAPLTTLGM